MSKSLSWRLTLSAVCVTTIILVCFGVYDYNSTVNSLTKRIGEDIHNQAEFLQSTLPSPLWNYEEDLVQQNIESAIKNTSISAILITDGTNFVNGIQRNDSGEVGPLEGIPEDVSEWNAYDLIHNDGSEETNIGQLLVLKNTRLLEEIKQDSIYSTALKILLLDVLVIISLILLSNRLVKEPLQEVSLALKDISSGGGDLTQRLSNARDDEIGQVAQYFNTFVAKIQEAMKMVEGSASQLTKSVETINSNSRSNAITFEQIHTESGQVAAAITQMNSNAHNVAVNAQETSEAARVANQETQKALAVINETSGSISTLASDIEKGTTVMSYLQNNVNGIINVLNTIQGIAEQTNLLALNAAIEAARAGDQGRGFAVVADEVRALAARTQESTGEIQNMIEKLEEGTAQAVSVMELSMSRSEESVAKVSGALGSLSDINKAMSSIDRMSTQIASAVEEQTQVTDEISRSIANITNVIQNTTIAAKETEETSAVLTGNARTLNQLVSQFKL